MFEFELSAETSRGRCVVPLRIEDEAVDEEVVYSALLAMAYRHLRDALEAEEVAA